MPTVRVNGSTGPFGPGLRADVVDSLGEGGRRGGSVGEWATGRNGHAPSAEGEPPKGSVHARTRKGIGMAVGTVKFFNAEKGYGLVSRDDGEDVFVHYSNVAGTGFRTLEAGQQVEFEIAAGRKGDEARNVKVI